MQSVASESRFNSHSLTASAAHTSGSLQTALSKLPRDKSRADPRVIAGAALIGSYRLWGVISAAVILWQLCRLLNCSSIVSYPWSLLDRSARAEYIVPPNSEGRVASLSMRSTPASVKSWRSRSKPTGYGPHLFGLDRSYSTIKKRSVTERRLLRNICCS
jgi:hypothetical protein